MKRSIIVRTDVEGLHLWPDCNLPHVEYLAHLHRHTFQIFCEVNVTHGNRDIEFIDLKHKIKQYVANEDLLNYFGLTKCSVSEDGEFFGVVEA